MPIVRSAFSFPAIVLCHADALSSEAYWQTRNRTLNLSVQIGNNLFRRSTLTHLHPYNVHRNMITRLTAPQCRPFLSPPQAVKLSPLQGIYRPASSHAKASRGGRVSDSHSRSRTPARSRSQRAPPFRLSAPDAAKRPAAPALQTASAEIPPPREAYIPPPPTVSLYYPRSASLTAWRDAFDYRDIDGVDADASVASSSCAEARRPRLKTSTLRALITITRTGSFGHASDVSNSTRYRSLPSRRAKNRLRRSKQKNPQSRKRSMLSGLLRLRAIWTSPLRLTQPFQPSTAKALYGRRIGRRFRT